MMKKVRCDTCVGSGKVMGGGMMHVDCDDCDGKGKIFVDEEKEFFIDKNSKHYKDAIHKIKSIHDGITSEKAEEIFEDEFKKINIKDDENVSKKSGSEKTEIKK